MIPPQRSSQATLITGLLGSGKTWSLTNQLLQAARTGLDYDGSSNNSLDSSPRRGSLLALGRQVDCASLREKADLDRPLGCTKCDILTFPSLVRRIVHDFGPTVGSYANPDAHTLSRSSLAVFLHRNLDSLPLGKYRPLHAPGDAVRPLLLLFSSLAHCGVDPADYLQYVENLEAELAAGEKQTASTDVPSQGGAGEGEHMLTGAAATRAQLRAQMEAETWRNHVSGERDKANSYAAFVALKRREEVADYSDHLLLARRIFKESTTARSTLSLGVSHVFVDDLHEYSPAMVDILAGIIAPGVGITATADPLLAASNAAGVAFGRELTGVAQFKKAFPESVELRLVGRRQRTDAIQVAMRALEPRDAPVSVQKPRAAKRSKSATKNGDSVTQAATNVTSQDRAPGSTAAGGSTLTCLTFETEGEELRALGLRIRELTHRGVSPGDIGVAAVGGWGAVNTLTAAVSAAGVPVEGGHKTSSAFDGETPRMLMSFLRCLVHPSESTPLLHLLMNCPAYALPGGELATALESHLSRYVPLRSFLQNSHLGEQGMDPRVEDGMSAGARMIAGRLLSDITRFAEVARKRGVREVMRDFLRHTGQLERLEDPTTREEEQEGRAVAKLFEAVAMAEKQAGSDNVTLVEPILRLFRRHGVRYEESNPLDQEEGDMRANTSRGSSSAVSVFRPGGDDEAACRSYHTVFVPFCSRSRLPGNLRTARLPVPGPFRGAPEPRDTASLRLENDLARVSHENRARAVLYAAMSAARHDICLSVSSGVSRGRTRLNPSPFLAEILGADAPRECNMVDTTVGEARDRTPSKEKVPDVAVASVSASCAIPRQGGGRDGVVASGPLRLSFSSISSYASCPYSYYLQYVLNVSPPPNPRMVYGRAMHEAVASFLRGTIDGNPGPTLQSAVQEFTRQFDGCAFESAAQVRALTANGIAGLESFLGRLVEHRAMEARIGGDTGCGGGPEEPAGLKGDLALPSRMLVERKFMVNVPEAHTALSGIFDRVDIAPGVVGGGMSSPLVSITDYKSNVGAKVPSRMVRNNLQLQIYSLAAERLFGVMPVELAIESIEDGRRGVAVPSAADVEVALGAISSTATEIRVENFEATPSFQACTFCGFKHACRHSSITSSAL